MTPPSSGLIELRLSHAGQLFNTMDPSPFHERDLDHDAEEFIVGWAREHDALSELKVRVVLPGPADPVVAAQITESIRHYFDYRSRITGRDLLELFREGRTTLSIGLVFLAGTLALRRLVPGDQPWGSWIREGLTICGWVGLWKPIDIMLYRWWPLRRQQGLQRRLSEALVEVVYESVAPPR
jgi:hypothetical protein